MSSSEETPHFCAQMFLPMELAEKAVQRALRENPDNAIHSPDLSTPSAGGLVRAGPGASARIGLFVRKMWANGRTLRVRFLSGGTPWVRSKVKQYANVWSKYANIKFQFVDSEPSDIRITFTKGGSWSYIGTDSLLQSVDVATMNYGWFNDQTTEEEFSRTILHEFGHAIGCIHEHSSPYTPVVWNKPVVYASYKERGWTPQEVESNIFFHYDESDVRATAFDATSIMEYPIPQGFTTNGFTAGWNTQLSPTDIAFIQKMYPKPPPPTAVPVATRNLQVGVFNTMSSPGSTSSDHQAFVDLPRPYEVAPGLVTGLNFLDFDNSRNLRIRCLVEAALPSQAVFNLQSWGDTIQYASGLSWFAFPLDDSDFQYGSFTTKDAMTQQAVSFSRPYHSPPTVLVFFHTLDVDRSAHCRVTTYTSDLTTRGFKVHVEAWANTKLWQCGVTWLAFPSSKPGIAAGSFNTGDVPPSTTPTPQKKGTVAFRPVFSKPPRIFMALNKLEVDRNTQTRVRLSGSSISGEKMEWHVDSWGDTTLYSAGASYIAIEG